jgi:hypothetical protein
LRNRWLELSNHIEYSENERRDSFNDGIISKLEEYRKKNNGVTFTNVQSGLLKMPTSKTSSIEKFREYLTHFSKHAIEIMNFNLLNGSRNMSFNNFVKKQKGIFFFLLITKIKFI